METDFNHKLQDAKRQYEQVSVDDPDAFKAKVLASVQVGRGGNTRRDKSLSTWGFSNIVRKLLSFRRLFTTGTVFASGVLVASLLIMVILKPQHLAPNPTQGANSMTNSIQVYTVPYWGLIVIGVIAVLGLLLTAMVGLHNFMKVVRFPAFWGSLIGIFVGYFGMPVTPLYNTQWTWEHPVGFYTSSVLVFGTLGGIVGLLIHQSIKKQLDRTLLLWSYSVFTVALLAGSFGFYRLEASSQSTIWQLARQGLSHTIGAAYNFSSGKPSQKVLNEEGEQLIIAAADLGSASEFSGEYHIKTDLLNLAEALNGAGTTLINATSESQVQPTEQMVEQIGTLVGNATKNHGTLNPRTISEIVSKANVIVGSQFNTPDIPN